MWRTLRPSAGQAQQWVSDTHANQTEHETLHSIWTDEPADPILHDNKTLINLTVNLANFARRLSFSRSSACPRVCKFVVIDAECTFVACILAAADIYYTGNWCIRARINGSL